MRNQALALVALGLMSQSALAASPLGDWMTEDGSGIVRIGPCGSVQVRLIYRERWSREHPGSSTCF